MSAEHIGCQKILVTGRPCHWSVATLVVLRGHDEPQWRCERHVPWYEFDCECEDAPNVRAREALERART